MMCMECRNDYLQQVSSAHNTLDFCSVQCELTYISLSECELACTEYAVRADNESVGRPHDA